MSKKVVLIVQARMGSTRLPGKSMMKLAGEPLVGRMLERLKNCNSINEIILAIPFTKENHVLADIGRKYDIKVYRGSENNLVDRYYQSAKESKADIVVRIPADNPTPEPKEIDKIIQNHYTFNSSFFGTNLCNFCNSGYPDGIGAEVFDFSLLEDLHNRNLTDSQKEHVHTNFLDYNLGIAVNPEWCLVRTLKCPEEIRRPDIILDVNTIDQYKYMNDLYNYLYPRNNNFSIADIIEWHDNIYKKS